MSKKEAAPKETHSPLPWEETPCIPFRNSNNNGYGRIQIGGKEYLAHRASYVLANGPIPDGLHLDHLCRNRRCVNPMHLEAVTRKTNILRGISPSANNARKMICKRGHPLFGSNIVIHKRGERRCRVCARLADIHRRAKNGSAVRRYKNRPTAMESALISEQHARAALALAQDSKGGEGQ